MEAVHLKSGLTPLNMAIKQFSMVKLLTENGANINSTASLKGRTALHEAVIIQSLQRVKTIIKRGADLEVEAEEGTPLIIASLLGMEDIVKELVNEGARVDHDVQGWTIACCSLLWK